MVSIDKSYYYAMVLSAIINGLFWCGLFVKMTMSLGMQKPLANVNAYLVKLENKKTESAHHDALQKKSPYIIAVAKVKAHSVRQQKKSISTISTQTYLPHDQLTERLHDAIAAQQHYPEAALQLRREGNVEIEFYLLTSGDIKDLHIASSSGTASLDQAALRAVHAASPFTQVVAYLKQAEQFRVKVVFGITE